MDTPYIYYFLLVTHSSKLELFEIDESETSAKLKWSDHKSAKIQLKRISEIDCFYEGSFKEEENSHVFVTGCDNQVRNVQIQSAIFGDFYGTSKNATPYEVTETHSPLKNPDETKIKNVIEGREIESVCIDGECINPFWNPTLSPDVSFDGQHFPYFMWIKVKIYVSPSWQQIDPTQQRLRGMVEHANLMFKHRSLKPAFNIKDKLEIIPTEHDFIVGSDGNYQGYRNLKNN